MHSRHIRTMSNVDGGKGRQHVRCSPFPSSQKRNLEYVLRFHGPIPCLDPAHLEGHRSCVAKESRAVFPLLFLEFKLGFCDSCFPSLRIGANTLFSDLDFLSFFGPPRKGFAFVGEGSEMKETAAPANLMVCRMNL